MSKVNLNNLANLANLVHISNHLNTCINGRGQNMVKSTEVNMYSKIRDKVDREFLKIILQLADDEFSFDLTNAEKTDIVEKPKKIIKKNKKDINIINLDGEKSRGLS